MRGALSLALLVAAAAADTAVLADGTILRGPMQVEGDAVVANRRKFSLDAVLLVEDDRGVARYCRSMGERMRAYELLARERQLADYTRLLDDAMHLRTAELAWMLLRKAEATGFEGREALVRHRDVSNLMDSGGVEESGAVGAQAERIRAEMRRVDAFLEALLAQRAAAALPAGREGLLLLHEALAACPRAAPLLDLLSKTAPDDFPLGKEAWLEWTLGLGAAGALFAEDSNPSLAHWRGTWRKDLQGVRSGPLLLLTPVRDLHLVGRCVSLARLVFGEMEKMFPQGAERVEAPPLVVLLYESAEEYRLRAAGGDPEAAAFLEWTNGHYSPGERLSRFFWRKDRDAERRTIRVCAHELTHHWLAQRAFAGRATSAATPGFWVAEGFATFMEEGIYDPEKSTCTLFSPRARSLDCVAALAQARGLLAWETVLSVNQAACSRLSPKYDRPIGTRWTMGTLLLSQLRTFYEQAGATCQFLYHAEGGRHRQALLRCIEAWYGGRAADLDVERAFGMKPAELGAKVVEFARAVQGGWRPG